MLNVQMKLDILIDLKKLAHDERESKLGFLFLHIYVQQNKKPADLNHFANGHVRFPIYVPDVISSVSFTT